jgi:hypothetical protein
VDPHDTSWAATQIARRPCAIIYAITLVTLAMSGGLILPMQSMTMDLGYSTFLVDGIPATVNYVMQQAATAHSVKEEPEQLGPAGNENSRRLNEAGGSVPWATEEGRGLTGEGRRLGSCAAPERSIPGSDLQLIFVLRDHIPGSILEPRHLKTVRRMEQAVRSHPSYEAVSVQMSYAHRPSVCTSTAAAGGSGTGIACSKQWLAVCGAKPSLCASATLPCTTHMLPRARSLLNFLYPSFWNSSGVDSAKSAYDEGQPLGRFFPPDARGAAQGSGQFDAAAPSAGAGLDGQVVVFDGLGTRLANVAETMRLVERLGYLGFLDRGYAAPVADGNGTLALASSLGASSSTDAATDAPTDAATGAPTAASTDAPSGAASATNPSGGGGGGSARTLSAWLEYGLPIAGYPSAQHQVLEQKAELNQHLKELSPFLEALSSDSDSIRVYYEGLDSYSNEFFDAMLSDLVFVAGSVTFMGVYIWFQVTKPHHCLRSYER